MLIVYLKLLGVLVILKELQQDVVEDVQHVVRGHEGKAHCHLHPVVEVEAVEHQFFESYQERQSFKGGSNGKTSLVHYRTLSFCLSFKKKTKVRFFS